MIATVINPTGTGNFVGGTSGTWSWWGLATTSALTSGQLLYNTTGGNGVASIATTSLSLSSAFSHSGTLGALVGGTSGTLSLATNGVALTNLAQIAGNTILGNPTGALGNVQAFATSSLGIALSDTTGTLAITRGGTGTTTAPSSQLLYGGGAGVYQSVATSSATLGLGLTGSLTTIGGSQSLTLATSSLYSGTTGGWWPPPASVSPGEWLWKENCKLPMAYCRLQIGR